MAQASNGDDVDAAMAREALEHREGMLPPALLQYAQFYQTLFSAHYFLNALADEDAQEHDPGFMAHVRAENPGAWDDATASVADVKALVAEYVAEHYPDEVVWTLTDDPDVDVEV